MSVCVFRVCMHILGFTAHFVHMWQVQHWAMKAQELDNQFAKVCAYCQWWIDSSATNGDEMVVLPDPLDAATLQATVARLQPSTSTMRPLDRLDCKLLKRSFAADGGRQHENRPH